MSYLRNAVRLLANRKARHEGIYERFRDYTMVPRDTYIRNLQLAEQVEKVRGCVVECGVWKGGMIAGLAAVLGPARKYYLFDSFCGLPPARDIDGRAALEWQKNVSGASYFDNCSAPPEHAKRAMVLSGAKRVAIQGGWFSETLRAFDAREPIALLRLDADWYESTMACLEALYDYVAPNGIILLDDYYTWDGCSRALHDFLSRRSATERIRNHGEACYLRKSAGEQP